MEKKKPRKIMILTLSAGGGHLQAAKAKLMQLRDQEEDAEILEQDLLYDWFSKTIGQWMCNLYDNAQRRGDANLQDFFISYCQPIFDRLFWPVMFIQALRILYKEEVDRIIDTQPLGTSAILKAMHVIHKFTGKQIQFDKILTELPTNNISHFFKPIKRLSEKYRSKLRLITTFPLLTDYKSAADFWKDQCGLTEQGIHYEELPLRPKFIQFANTVRKADPLELRVQTHTKEETKLVTETLDCGSIAYTKFDDHIDFVIQPEEKVSVIMLGSKPHEKATLKYVENFISICAKSSCPTRKDHLFVFCSASAKGTTSLLTKVHNLVTSHAEYPKNLTIIPLSFQDDEVIAPLFFRSDATFTRSGGLTSMELLSVCSGNIWIHAERPASPSRFNVPMPHWEEGNAYYLKVKKGAEFINPDTFQEVSQKYFQ